MDARHWSDRTSGYPDHFRLCLDTNRSGHRSSGSEDHGWILESIRLSVCYLVIGIWLQYFYVTKVTDKLN